MHPLPHLSPRDTFSIRHFGCHENSKRILLDTRESILQLSDELKRLFPAVERDCRAAGAREGEARQSPRALGRGSKRSGRGPAKYHGRAETACATAKQACELAGPAFAVKILTWPVRRSPHPGLVQTIFLYFFVLSCSQSSVLFCCQ